MSISEPSIDFSELNRDNPSVQRILRTATLTFGKTGYRGTSMQHIATQAGVSKSLVHYHFDSKEHLFLEVQLGLLRDLLNYVRSLARTSTEPSSTQFHRALDEIRGFIDRDLEQLRVMLEFHTVARENPRIARHIATFQQEITQLVVTGIHNVLDPRTIERLAIPPGRLARLLLQVLNGLVVDLAYAQGPEATQRVYETFEDVRTLLTEALFKPGSLRTSDKEPPHVETS